MDTAVLAVVVTRIVTRPVLASTTSARTRARSKEPVDLIRNVRLQNMYLRVCAPMALRATLCPSKDACVCHLFAQLPINAPPDICALVTSAVCHAMTQMPVLWENGATEVCALRCAIPTTTVYPEKCATMTECAKPVVNRTRIAQQLKCAVPRASASARPDLLALPMDARISMSAPRTRAIPQLVVRIPPDRTSVVAQLAQCLAHLLMGVVCYPINATRIRTVRLL